MAQPEDYRTLLKDELVTRQSRHESYSVRAFARDLGLAPSFCVQVLNGKRHLSEDRATQVLDYLKWTETKRRHFLTSLKHQRSRTSGLKQRYEADLVQWLKKEQPRELAQDEFRLIADWFHYALLELSRREDFVSDIDWIRKKLGIKRSQVKASIELLLRLGLLKETEGKLHPAHGFYSTGDVPSAAIRANHSQHLKLAAEAIETQAVGKRDFSGITMAIDPERLDEARSMIRDFRRQMMAFLEGGKRRRVYRLNIQLFALDQEIEQ